MSPSLADLLCCEDFSGCFSDSDVENDDDDEEEEEEEEEEERRKRKRGYNLPSSSSSSSLSWRDSMAMVQPGEEEEDDDDEDEEEEEEDDYDNEDIDIETTFTALVEREIFHVPCSDYLRKYEEKILDVESRQNAINWLFKVRDFYKFGPLTAALSVNYLDRFLSLHRIPKCKGWMMQLLSVACLSLAAKMEETEVPLLLDLQVGPDCIFEPRTIQRMELLVLSTLEWRLSSVTPFSYIDFFVRYLDLASDPHCVSCARIDELILSAFQDIRFLYYLPSSIAAAAVLCAAQEMCSPQLIEFKKILFSMFPQHLHDSSESCFMLMAEIFCKMYINQS